MRPCILVPFYNHPERIAAVLGGLARLDLPCLVVDDGSDDASRQTLERLCATLPWVSVERLPFNQGRGAALRHGYRVAAARGFSHVVQLDSDGQHDPDDVPRLLAAACRQPRALVLGQPVFDASAPLNRLYGRRISRFWARVETRSTAIGDPLCGFRCLPLEPTIRLLAKAPLGDRMDFDPELAVRLVWEGLTVARVPVRVRYFADGRSHFRLVRDNIAITGAHTRLVVGALVRWSCSRRDRPPEHPVTAATWWRVAERGSVWAMRLTVGIYRLLGLRLTTAFIAPVIAYFFLTNRETRRASRQYLQRLYEITGGVAALARAPTWRDCFRHYRQFGLTVLDRLVFATGGGDRIQIALHGREHFTRLLERRQGGVLLGAHLGSFDALRALAARAGIVVHVLMYTRHAERINSVLRKLDPQTAVRVIRIDHSSLDILFRLKECVERGEFVAILGDRVPPGRRPRLRRVPFLGAPAPFPEGPFLLASLLGCPVLFMVALRRHDARYEIFAEVLSERVELPRREREARLEHLISAYAQRIEVYCRQAPYQWFNFYDFWDNEAAMPPRTPA